MNAATRWWGVQSAGRVVPRSVASWEAGRVLWSAPASVRPPERRWAKGRASATGRLSGSPWRLGSAHRAEASETKKMKKKENMATATANTRTTRPDWAFSQGLIHETLAYPPDLPLK